MEFDCQNEITILELFTSLNIFDAKRGTLVINVIPRHRYLVDLTWA